MAIFLTAGLISAFAAAATAYFAGQGLFMILIAYSAGGALGGLTAVISLLAIQYLANLAGSIDKEAGETATVSAS